MSESTIHGGRELSRDEALVQRLLEGAGPRPEVPAEDLAAIKAAFRAEWRARVGRRRRGWRLEPRFFALAATLAATFGLAFWLWTLRPTPGLGPVAEVEAVAGGVFRQMEGEGSASLPPLASGQPIDAGTRVETAGGAGQPPGGIAFRLAGGASLRLDAGSRVQLVSATQVRLERGAVYVDSGAAPGAGGGIEILTSLGVARDIGTQFEVRLLNGGPAALRVRVREGKVLVEKGGGFYAAEHGTELTLHADGSASRGEITAADPAWAWVLRAAPAFDIEGQTLHQFLRWLGRETGWEVRYAEPSIEAASLNIVVHGDISGLAAAEALEVVLPGAGLAHRLDDGVLWIRAAGPGGD